jgi:hypothetical protein
MTIIKAVRINYLRQLGSVAAVAAMGMAIATMADAMTAGQQLACPPRPEPR